MTSSSALYQNSGFGSRSPLDGRCRTTGAVRLTSILLCILLLYSIELVNAQQPTVGPHDDYGILDTVVVMVQWKGGNQWEAVVSLTNDENVAAVTLPMRILPGFGSYRLDSATYEDTRTSYFALKTFFPDSIRSTILIGLISDLGTNLPPLEPGAGPISRLFFTALDETSGPLALDTTFINPHNVLQLVTPDVRAILPAFEFHGSLSAGGPGRGGESADNMNSLQ